MRRSAFHTPAQTPPVDATVRKPREQRAGRIDVDLDLTVLRLDLRCHGAAEVVNDHLHPVADPQRGDTQIENSGIIGRCAALPDACGPAGENHGVIPRELVRRHTHRQDVGIDPRLPDFTVDHLGVLSATVDNCEFLH